MDVSGVRRSCPTQTIRSVAHLAQFFLTDIHLFQLTGHIVKGVAQHGDLVIARDRHPFSKISQDDFARCLTDDIDAVWKGIGQGYNQTI